MVSLIHHRKGIDGERRNIRFRRGLSSDL